MLDESDLPEAKHKLNGSHKPKYDVAVERAKAAQSRCHTEYECDLMNARQHISQGTASPEEIELVRTDDEAEQNEADKLSVFNFDEIEPTEIEWLWPNRIPIGKQCLLVGDPCQGKSFLTIDLAARVSTGAKWPDCNELAPQGRCLILNAEDDPHDTVLPRLISAGADRSQVSWVQGIKRKDKDGPYERLLDLQRDIELLGNRLASMQNCKLVVIDPISCYMGETDSHKNADVRSTLAPLAALAAAQHSAVIMVSHLTKGESKAIYRTMGSLAFVAAARAVWCVVRDKDDEAKRLMLPVKINIAPDRKGLAFYLKSRHSEGKTPRVEWLAGEVEITADEALAPKERRKGPEPEAQDEAADFLRGALAHGPRWSGEIYDDAKEARISVSTLKRAKDNLRVESFHPEGDRRWWWRLPENYSLKSGATSLAPEPLEPLEILTGSKAVTTTADDQLVVGAQVPVPWEIPEHVGDDEHVGGMPFDDLDDANRAFMEAAEQEDF